jgi:small nuclear ribonucleoprotein F
MAYRGTLLAIDNYMNVQLDQAEEIVNEKSEGVLGEVLIRCNNVLYVRAEDAVANQMTV